MTEPLKFKELSLHIDVSFWFELERRKLNDWRLEEPKVSLTGWIPSATRLKNQLPGLLSISADSFTSDRKLQNQSCLPVMLQNFNTVEQLVNLEKKAALTEAGNNIIADIDAGKWDAANFTRAFIYTFSDLKTHKFSYIAAVPTLDFGSAVRSKKPAKAADVLGSDLVQKALDHAHSIAESSCGAAPFVLDGTTVHPFNPSSVGTDSAVIAFTDSSNLPEYPGWPLRNLIAAVRMARPKKTAFTVLCLRESADASLVFECECDPLEGDKPRPTKTLGWVETKIRHVEMGAQMDPTRLADSSASLNLGLMKWRMMPDIQLDELKGCKALLLGSGTLGCNVARNLMMWGVRHITLIDRGNVSYSNPVRQSLFELSDCQAEGEARIKSIAAARALKRILPTVNATGVQLTIRMPGHRIDPEHKEEAVADITKLEELIKEHDVTYLLTDSREARWLPTLLATVHNKPVINAALGFDSYVVMRHGLPSQDSKDRVGCYFCNDVVAPIDSLTARTLDQQCTVTRPGVSAIASALAVELHAAAYNHPKGFNAPAFKTEDDFSESSGVLGILPHQARGSISDYTSMNLHGQAYTMCTACSDIMVTKYKNDGIDFLIACLNKPDLMEEVTGLKAERERAQEQHGDWDDEDF